MKKIFYFLPLLIVACTPKVEKVEGLMSDTLKLDSPKVEVPVVVDSNEVDTAK